MQDVGSIGLPIFILSFLLSAVCIINSAIIISGAIYKSSDITNPVGINKNAFTFYIAFLIADAEILLTGIIRPVLQAAVFLIITV